MFNKTRDVKMKLTNNNQIDIDPIGNVTVLTKYGQPHFLFSDLPEKYRSLMEFDAALVKEHYQQKNTWKDGYAFLHEPYFE